MILCVSISYILMRPQIAEMWLEKSEWMDY